MKKGYEGLVGVVAPTLTVTAEFVVLSLCLLTAAALPLVLLALFVRFVRIFQFKRLHVCSKF